MKKVNKVAKKVMARQKKAGKVISKSAARAKAKRIITARGSGAKATTARKQIVQSRKTKRAVRQLVKKTQRQATRLSVQYDKNGNRRAVRKPISRKKISNIPSGKLRGALAEAKITKTTRTRKSGSGQSSGGTGGSGRLNVKV